jgi:hypothetical protein
MMTGAAPEEEPMPPSTNNKTWTEYSPISMRPAATGWSAVYVNDTPDDGGPAWTEEPVIAWAVYQVTIRPVHGSVAPEGDAGRQILGVVNLDGSLGAPENTGDFWRYRGPGQPEPTQDEIDRELAFRSNLARRRSWPCRLDRCPRTEVPWWKLQTRLDNEAIEIAQGRTEMPAAVPRLVPLVPPARIGLVDEVLVRVGRRDLNLTLDWPPVHLVHQLAYRVKLVHLGELRMRGPDADGGRIESGPAAGTNEIR